MAILSIALTCVASTALSAQQPTAPLALPQQLPAGIAAYRAPSIAMVQPTTTTPTGIVPGGSVPQDRPVVFFRFLQGEATDPIDGTSLSVTLAGAGLSTNGESRTALFQVAAADAWGPLADPKASADLAPGTYQVTARICSMRGACSTTTTPVTVTPAPRTTPAITTGSQQPSLEDRILGVLIRLRRLFDP